MSTKITSIMIRKAYKVARRIYEQQISRQQGINVLVMRVGFNRSSAADTVDNYKYMRKGEGYERKNNLFTAKHFLEMIYQDDGVEALRKALDSLERHLDYYEGVKTGGPQPGQRKLLDEFRKVADKNVPFRGSNGLTKTQRLALAHEEKQLQARGDFEPTDVEDARKRILANIVRRQGQSKFRKQLLSLYACRCAVTGCSVDAVLEAAHITPYLGPKTNHPTNGIILRADIHTLFDLGLITVDAKTMTVLISPVLNGTEYQNYGGKSLFLPKKKTCRPSPAALNQHRKGSGL